MKVPTRLLHTDSNSKVRLIIIFAAVGLLLVALLLGGLYIAKNRGEQAARGDSVEIESPVSTNGQNAPIGDPEETPSTSDNSGSAGQNDTSGGDTSNEATSNEATVDELPSSGPTENLIISALAVATVTYAAARYAQSRRLA